MGLGQDQKQHPADQSGEGPWLWLLVLVTCYRWQVTLTEFLKAGNKRLRKILLSLRNILVVERDTAKIINFLPGFNCLKKKNMPI